MSGYCVKKGPESCLSGCCCPFKVAENKRGQWPRTRRDNNHSNTIAGGCEVSVCVSMRSCLRVYV